ncbi:MAG: hypothetical protein NC235_07550 [Clostridiales bacterium]|nr:hypothetical protein [Clostridiales bacterium]MCM1576988.1 hypothetical protein [Bacteroides sp.]
MDHVISQEIADRHGGVCTPINYKTPSSIERKCMTDKINPSELRDIVRTTIIVDRDSIEDVIFELQESGIAYKVKRQSSEDYYGYSGTIVNVRHERNYMIGEIQINTPKMIYVKETEKNAKSILGTDLWEDIHKEIGLEGGLGHYYYEKIRDPKNGDRLEFINKSVEYYSHFR